MKETTARKRKDGPSASAKPATMTPQAEPRLGGAPNLSLCGAAGESFRARKHPLEEIFGDALAQATRGKGHARHGLGRDSSERDNFLAQDWRAIARRHGPGFLSGQAEKKLREALELPAAERRTELLGVLVYVGMLILHHDGTST
jgi:hypothetical protein